MSNKPYLIGIDIGTYSAKGVLVHVDGTIHASHTVEYDLSMPQPGWAEHDADAIWWHSFTEITRSLISQSAIDAQEIAAIGCSTIGPTMLPVDSRGKPLRPAILYGIDTRTWREVEELTAQFGKEAVFTSTGKPLTTQSNGPKILWFRKNQPELFEKTHKIITATGYLNYKLTGAFTVDIYSAAAFDPMFDIPTLNWNPARVEPICPLEFLPELHQPTDVIGTVHAQAAHETGLAEGTPVIAGTIDAAAEALSVGITEPGETMLMYGTTLFILHVTQGWLRHPQLWSSPYLLQERYVLCGGLSTSAALTRWFRDQFAQPELAQEHLGGPNAYETLAERAASIPPGSNGLIALPYFSGERTPINDPKARGVIAGLTLSHTSTEIYRALLEGVAYALRHNLETMRETGTDFSRLIAVGGGTKNATWLHIISDCLGQPQYVPKNTIGASYGDAYLAGYGTGIFGDYTVLRNEWVKHDRIIEPNAAHHARYGEYYPIYKRTYEQLKNELHALANLQA